MASISPLNHCLLTLSPSSRIFYLYGPVLRLIIENIQQRLSCYVPRYLNFLWRTEKSLSTGDSIPTPFLASNMPNIMEKPEHLAAFPTTSQKPLPQPMPLLSLPTEIHLLIASHLPPDALLALRLTRSYFFYTLGRHLPSPSDRSLTPCQRFAIQQHLQQFSKPATTTTKSSISTNTGTRSLRRCILCKNPYPPYMFSSNHSPACLPSLRHHPRPRPPPRSWASFNPYDPYDPDANASNDSTDRCGLPSPPPSPGPESNVRAAAAGAGAGAAGVGATAPDREVLDLPDGLCAWHVGRLTRVVRLPEAASVASEAGSRASASAAAGGLGSVFVFGRWKKGCGEGGEADVAGNGGLERRRGGEKGPGWWATRERMCTHCGEVWWRDGMRDCEDGGEGGEQDREIGGEGDAWGRGAWTGSVCGCACETCGPVEVCGLTRYLSAEEEERRECSSWRFWRDEFGVLYVRENVGLTGRGDEGVPIKDVRVIFE